MARQNKQRTNWAVVAAGLLALAVAGGARAAAPAVLEQTPADAKAVVVINNVKTFSTNVGNAAVRLSPAVPPDLAGYATRMLGITKGFDFNGSVGLVVMNDRKGEKEDEMAAGPPALVLLLPTTDAKGMLEGMQPAEADKDGVSELTLPGPGGDKGYAATVGTESKWVALAQDRDVLMKCINHKGSLAAKLPAETLKVFEANDVVAWASIPAVSDSMEKLLENRQQDITGMMDLANLNNGQPELISALQKAAVNEIFGGVKEYFRDAREAMVTLRVRDGGVTLGLIGNFKAESPFGKFVAAQKPAGTLSLKGLPGGDPLMAFAARWDGKSVGDAIAAAAKRIMADPVIAKDPRAADMQNLVDQYQTIFSTTGGMSMAILDKGLDGKDGIMNGAGLLETTEPEKVLAVQAEYYKNPLIKEIGSGNGDIEQEMSVTPDAITVKGVKLMKVHASWKLREETADKPLKMGSKEGFAMIQKMYGKDGVTFYFGVVGKHVLTVIGSDAATLEGAVAAAQANGDELATSEMVTGSKDHVVPNAVAVVYFPLVRWVGVMMNAMQGVVPGMPAMPPAKAGGANVPPLVMSAGVSGTTLTVEWHVPVAAMVAVKEAVQGMMGGGAAPGGGMQP